MKIIYFGTYISEELKKRKIRQIAGEKWEANLINCLKKEVEEIIIYSYFRPGVKQYVVPNKKQKRMNKNTSKLLFFINFIFLREISLFLTTSFELLKLKIKYKNLKDIKILQYNFYFPISFPIFIFSFFYNYEYIPIILDIILEDSYKFSWLKKFYIGLELKLEKIVFKFLKKVIVINEYIIKDFFRSNIKYLVIEGGVSSEDIDFTKNIVKDRENNTKKKIVFTGRIDFVNGIDFLINTFKKIKNKNVELIIYGKGEYENYLKTEIKADKRIKYYGFIENKEAMKEQKNADFLIIPRKMSNPILRYTFPSKLFEYMLSGTPIISTNIPGLKKEYKDNMYVIDTENEEKFAEYIEKILMKEKIKLLEKGKEARKFIIKNKTWRLQVQKIIDFLN